MSLFFESVYLQFVCKDSVFIWKYPRLFTFFSLKMPTKDFVHSRILPIFASRIQVDMDKQ